MKGNFNKIIGIYNFVVSYWKNFLGCYIFTTKFFEQLFNTFLVKIMFKLKILRLMFRQRLRLPVKLVPIRSF